MTTTDSLEEELSRMEIPTAPDDLLARCLSTVPAKPHARQAPERSRPWYQLASVQAFAATSFVIAGFVAIQWAILRFGNPFTPGGRAFAQTIQTAEGAPYWHTKSRYHDVLLQQPPLPQIPVVAETWNARQEWFDIDRGSVSITNWGNGTDRDTAISEVCLPSGLVYNRFGKSLHSPDGQPFGDNKMTVTHGSVTDWQASRLRLAAQAFGLPEISGHAGQQPEVIHGKWNGQSVNVFTIYEDLNAGLYRQREHEVIYSDSTTNRVLALQMYTSFPDQPNRSEVLTDETVFDYDRPAASVFDLAPLRDGASKIQNQWLIENSAYVDENGILVGVTAEWLRRHPNKPVGTKAR